MSGQSQCGGSAPWNSQDPSSAFVPFLRYGLVLKPRMVTSTFQRAKWRKDILTVFKDSACIILLLASCWPKFSLVARAAMETKNCLYFSRQLS